MGSSGREVSARPAVVAATFVGSEACAGCHRAEADLGRGSQHQLAMQDSNFASGALQIIYFVLARRAARIYL